MSFIDMTHEEMEAVRQHHDMLVEMAALELRADEVRESCPSGDLQQRLLQPIEAQMRQLDSQITHLAA